MRGVKLDRVEPGLLDAPGRLAEQVDQLEDLGDRRLADLLALLLGVLVDDLVARRPGQLEDAVRRAQRVVARDRALPAGMLQLDGALGAVAVHRLRPAARGPGCSCRRRRRGTSPWAGRSCMSGVVAPTMTNPAPPWATFAWWWMSRSLTSPSACDELMSVGTWTMRLGSVIGPSWSGLKRWGNGMRASSDGAGRRSSMLAREGLTGNARGGRRTGRTGRPFRTDRSHPSIWPCPIRPRPANFTPWPCMSGSRTSTRTSRSPCSSTPSVPTATRCTGTTTSRSRSCSKGRGVFLFGRRSLQAETGRRLLHRQLAAARGARRTGGSPLLLLLVLFRPELIAAPGCRELDQRLPRPVPARRATASPRVRGRVTPLAGEVAAGAPGVCSATWDRHDPAERQSSSMRRSGARSRSSTAGSSPSRATRRLRAAADDRREQIRPVLAYVDATAAESITLGDVAELVHVSPSRVRHVFKDVTGVGFKEYVTQVRVAEAKRLLLGTDLSVAEVARAVSYTNLHQFYKVFYRSCGDVAGRVPPLLHAGGGRAASRMPPRPRCQARGRSRPGDGCATDVRSGGRTMTLRFGRADGGGVEPGSGEAVDADWERRRADLLRGVRDARRRAWLPARLPDRGRRPPSRSAG